MKKIIILLALAVLIGGCAYHKALTVSEKVKLGSSKGKIFYTLANIWLPRHNEASSTNIHFRRSAILPAGTKVIMGEVNDQCIYFSSEFGAVYMLRLNQKNTIDMVTYFNRYFSETNPMAEGGKFYQFTKQEQENIKENTIDYGMSKEAVLMSNGYPPPEKGFTPDIKSDNWVYIEDGKTRIHIYFKDNKVVKIEDARARVKRFFLPREQKIIERVPGVKPVVARKETSNADEILKYKQLLDSGAITKEEYEQKKKQLLGGSVVEYEQQKKQLSDDPVLSRQTKETVIEVAGKPKEEIAGTKLLAVQKQLERLRGKDVNQVEEVLGKSVSETTLGDLIGREYIVNGVRVVVYFDKENVVSGWYI